VLDDRAVRHAGRDRRNLRSSYLRVRCFATAEAHFDFDFVAVFKEAPRRRTRTCRSCSSVRGRKLTSLTSETCWFFLASRLRLSCSNLNLPRSALRQTGGSAVAATSIRSSPASSARRSASSIGTTPTCWACSSMMRTCEVRIWRFVRGPVGTGGRVSNGRRGMGVLLPYFFFGPLLAIGGLGADFVLLPPRFDISHLLSRRCPGHSVPLVAAAPAVAIGTTALLVKARRAVDRLVVAGLEWNLGRLPAARARHVVHLARGTPARIRGPMVVVRPAAITLRLARCATISATTGLTEASAGVEILLAAGERE